MIKDEFMLEQVIGCAVSGGVLACLFLALKLFRRLFLLKKVSTAILDILFCTAASVMIFFFALAIDYGRLRFFQIALQIIGFISVLLVFDPVIERICERLTKKLYRKLSKLKAKICSIFAKKKVNIPKKQKKKKKSRFLRQKTLKKT